MILNPDLFANQSFTYFCLSLQVIISLGSQALKKDGNSGRLLYMPLLLS